MQQLYMYHTFYASNNYTQLLTSSYRLLHFSLFWSLHILILYPLSPVSFIIHCVADCFTLLSILCTALWNGLLWSPALLALDCVRSCIHILHAHNSLQLPRFATYICLSYRNKPELRTTWLQCGRDNFCKFNFAHSVCACVYCPCLWLCSY